MSAISYFARYGKRFLLALKRERAQDMIEFVVGFPIMVTMLLGIVEFGIVAFSYNTIANAAHEGARYGALHPSAVSGNCANPGAGIGEATCQLTSGLVPGRVQYNAAVVDSAVQVEVVYVYQFVSSPISRAVGQSGTITLRAVASMQIE